MTKIMLLKSEKMLNLDYENLPIGDIIEEEQLSKGISCNEFREYASDIYMKTFCLLQNTFKEQGEELFF
jgi:hypothetical protein